MVGNRTSPGGKGAAGGNGSGTGADGGNGSPGGAGGSGGAIDSTADMTITNSTIVANSAAGGGAAGANGTPSGPGPGPGPGQPGIGGGIDQRAMGTTLTHVTITANSAGGVGGGVDGAGGTVTVANSIIAGNVAAPPSLNCAGVLVDQGGNLEFAATSCPAGFLQANPKLTGLADNGGPTQTIALQPGSAAIQHVRTCVLTRDQRGVARPVGAACDSGAYQVAPPSLSGISGGGITTTSATIAAACEPEPPRHHGRRQLRAHAELRLEHSADRSRCRQRPGSVHRRAQRARPPAPPTTSTWWRPTPTGRPRAATACSPRCRR